MKTFLLLFIILALALVGIIFRPTPDRTISPTVIELNNVVTNPGIPKDIQTTALKESKEISKIWYGDKTVLFNQLKAWGAPDDVIVAVMFANFRKEDAGRRLAILYPKGIKRWSNSASLDRDSQVKLGELYSKRREEVRQLMGPDFDLTLLDDDPMRRLKWGNLSNEQAVKVKQITGFGRILYPRVQKTHSRV